MKILKSISIIALMLISIILFMNCEKESVQIQEQPLTPELIGEIHNKAMDHFKENFNPKSNLKITPKEFVDEMAYHNVKYLKEMFEKHTNSDDIEYSYNKIKQRKLYLTDKLVFDNFYKKENKYSNNTIEKFNVFEKITFLYDNKLISLEEKELISNLLKFHKLNYEKKISNSELEKRTLKISEDFKKLNPDISEIGSFFVASSIEIAKNSNQWWKENFYNKKENKSILSKSAIAPWVAADIIGGAAGGLINIFEQGASSGFKGPVSAGKVGWAVAKGAVMASAAPWSRLASLFRQEIREKDIIKESDLENDTKNIITIP